MPDDLGDLAGQTEHQNYWGATPPNGGLADLAGQQQMTHQPQQPNPAAPYLQGARDWATRTFVDPLKAAGFLPGGQDWGRGAVTDILNFNQSGLTGLDPSIRQSMPGFANTLGDLVQSPAARSVFSSANIGGIPLGGMMVGTRGYEELARRGGGDQALRNLEMAKQMEQQGFHRSQIMDAAEWFREKPSNIWNKEIFDNPSTLNEHEIPADHGYFVHETTVGKVLNHDDLYQVYPHLRDLPMTFSNNPGALRMGKHASFSWPTPQNPYGLININNPHIRLNSETKSTLLHELQHAIDSYEGRKLRAGFGWDDYIRLIEEVRARNTQFRAKYTPEQLKSKYPWMTQQQMENPIPEWESTP